MRTQLSLSRGSYALALSTDLPYKFYGPYIFHGHIPESIWLVKWNSYIPLTSVEKTILPSSPPVLMRPPISSLISRITRWFGTSDTL